MTARFGQTVTRTVDALGPRIGAVSDGQMTRRGLFLGEHGEHRRKLRALRQRVTIPAQMLDDAVRVRTQFRTEP